MQRFFRVEVAGFLTLGLLFGCAIRSAPHRRGTPMASAPAIDYQQEAANAAQALQIWYTPATGLYQSIGWWNSANAITVLANDSTASRSQRYASVFSDTFTAAQKTYPGFLNKFYDDEGWWALAWIDVYDLTRDTRYLVMAESIFANMSAAWDDTCHGGIWWSKDRRYKNAIANELFLSVAAHLANRTSGIQRSQYLEWANKEWRWFAASGMINSSNLINDGLKITSENGVAVCTNNGRTTWTYNQGVVLGGLAELAAASHDASVLESAGKIATAATSLLVDSSGVLHESCEPNCGADGVQFKGIFARNLVLLDQRHPKLAYKRFIDTNADAVWKHDRGTGFQLGEVWSGPFVTANASSQSSALDVIIAAEEMQR